MSVNNQLPLIQALEELGLAVITKEELQFFQNLHPSTFVFQISTQEARELISPYMAYTKSQLGQDLFALAASKTSSPGYFVEFGATDGVSLSNTWLLEQKLGWTGILAEPAKAWHSRLKANRNCIIDTRCVSNTTGEIVKFLEVNQSGEGSPVLSGLKEFADNGDWASKLRQEESIEYSVETVTLECLLNEHEAPEEIQFLSIDTEGSEFNIIKDFNFQRRKINAICIEHNYVEENRKAINALLTSNGYHQIAKGLTKWDDWYILGRGQ